MSNKKDKRVIPAFTSLDGKRYPKFTYIWGQKDFNVITHEIMCHIHFEQSRGPILKNAFTYDWRLWTLPELQDCLLEAGFKSATSYIHGFDQDGDSDDIFRARKKYTNELGWIAYLIADY